MGVTSFVIKGVVVSSLIWGGCSYLNRRVESLDDKIKKVEFTEEERKSVRFVVKQNPRLVANSIRVALEEGYGGDILKEVPRKTIVRALNESLTLEEKLYVVKGFATYEIGKVCDKIYEKLNGRYGK